MVAELERLYRDLDLDQLRVQRPSKFIFFCGGPNLPDATTLSSMRHFLLTIKKIEKKLKATVVLAETANNLYRDSPYQDLITFEEDIARISAMVLVIAESAGSLAELGAFASNQKIIESVTVIMQTKYANAESFVRFGPVRRLEVNDGESIGFFPWQVDKNSTILKRPTRLIVDDIVKYINRRLEKVPDSSLYNSKSGIGDFIIIYWLIYLCTAIPIGKIISYLSLLLDKPDQKIDQADVKKKIYAMRLAGWIDIIPYSSTSYFCCLYGEDPFHYSFRSGVLNNDSVRRKSDVIAAIQKDLALPDHVKRAAASKRKPLS